MNDSERKQHLLGYNPWWRRDDWEENDPDLAGARGNDLTAYEPRPLAHLVTGSLYLMLGPRRVGKSVAMKREIAVLLSRGLDPRAITFCPCESLGQQDLRRIVRIASDLTSGYEGDRYWFFDEITYVSDWAVVLKQLRDQTELRIGTVVATGSSAAKLREARGALGGREGPAGEIRLLLPMEFRDFARELYPQLAEALPQERVMPTDLLSDASSSYFAPLGVYIDEVAIAWERYLDIGGFPRAVADVKNYVDIQSTTADGIWNILTGDVLHVGSMSDRDVKVLLARLIDGMTSPLNVANISRTLKIGAQHTVADRINRLCASFYMWRASVTHDGVEPVAGGQDKLYSMDPLIARLPSLRDSAIQPPTTAKLNEQQVAVALLHALAPNETNAILDESAVLVRRQPRSGAEIDFVGPRIGTAIEAKYVSSNWKRERKAIVEAYGRGLIATRDILDTTGDVWAVPSGLLAWAIGR